MQEVLKKIKELVSLLEEKNKATDVLNAQLSQKKANLESLEDKAIAKLNNASAMERVYKKYADFDKSVIDFRNEKQDYHECMKNMREEEINIGKEKEELLKLKDELDKKKKALNKQAIAIKEKESDFNKKKDEFRAMISGKAIKDILK